MNIKKIISFALSIVMLSMVFFDVSAYAAPTVSLPDSSKAYIDGYTTKRTITVKYNCNQPIADPSISTSCIVGYCHAYIGRYRCKQKVNSYYYDALLIKSAMEPTVFYGTKKENIMAVHKA